MLSMHRMRFLARPKIDAISPQVGMPGDTVTITGSGFGQQCTADGVSAVEFGGYAFTQSAYIKWTDTEIVVKLPMDVQDGLVFVRTERGVSNPAFFSNMQDVPVPLTADTDAPKPAISSLTPKVASVGDVLTIRGSDFGAGPAGNDRTQGLYAVMFESAGKKLDALAAMGNIESWSRGEIKVRVADGATTGSVTVKTPNGESNAQTLTVKAASGTVQYGDTHTYIVQIASDVNGMSEASPSHIRLYFPRPVISAAQISSEMTESIPDVLDEIYQGTSLRTLKEQNGSPDKTRYQESYAVAVRSVSVKMNNTQEPPSRDKMNGRVYDAATSADACVPVLDSRIAPLSKEMAQGRTGAYSIARAIYDRMLDRFGLTETKTDTCDPLAMLESGKGDAYDFAVIYTALLRAAGVPSFPCSGVVVDKEMHTKVRWWNVFYVNGVGYVPVDMTVGKDSREAGFAKLDAQHITFSIGYNEIKSAIDSPNVVQRQKSYALQSIWEESSKQTRKYSSFWSDPMVIGVY